VFGVSTLQLRSGSGGIPLEVLSGSGGIVLQLSEKFSRPNISRTLYAHSPAMDRSDHLPISLKRSRMAQVVREGGLLLTRGREASGACVAVDVQLVRVRGNRLAGGFCVGSGCRPSKADFRSAARPDLKTPAASQARKSSAWTQARICPGDGLARLRI